MVLSFLTIFFALYVVMGKTPVYSVISLILTFFCITGHYILLNAQFLAIVNVIVYAGAIMVLFLFVLMFINMNKDTDPMKSAKWFYAAAIAAGMLLVVLVAALRESSEGVFRNPVANTGLVKSLGKLLFTDYIVPFELSGILFLAAMVGAVLLGKRDAANEPEQEAGN